MVIPTIKTFEIRSSDVSANNEAKPQAILHCLEDAAYTNANENGFGYDATSKKNVGWFLIKYHLVFEKKFKAEEEVKIKTWPSKTKGIYCQREFEIYDSDDNKVGCATSLWLLVSFDTKKILDPYKTFDFPELDEKYVMQEPFPKISTPTNFDFENTFQVTFDDIDLNKHVNNSNYLKYAINTLPYDFLLENFPKDILIQYSKEATIGDFIVSKVSFDKEKNESLHILQEKTSQKTLTSLCIRWEKTKN